MKTAQQPDTYTLRSSLCYVKGKGLFFCNLSCSYFNIKGVSGLRNGAKNVLLQEPLKCFKVCMAKKFYLVRQYFSGSNVFVKVVKVWKMNIPVEDR